MFMWRIYVACGMWMNDERHGDAAAMAYGVCSMCAGVRRRGSGRWQMGARCARDVRAKVNGDGE
jgi:hypothetical protein